MSGQGNICQSPTGSHPKKVAPVKVTSLWRGAIPPWIYLPCVIWHTRAAIGHGAAVAVAQRARVAGHTLRRSRVTANARDALLFPATVPSGF